MKNKSHASIGFAADLALIAMLPLFSIVRVIFLRAIRITFQSKVNNESSQEYGGQIWIDNANARDQNVYFAPVRPFSKFLVDINKFCVS